MKDWKVPSFWGLSPLDMTSDLPSILVMSSASSIGLVAILYKQSSHNIGRFPLDTRKSIRVPILILDSVFPTGPVAG